MAQAIVTVLIIIILLAYAGFFAVWNPDVVRAVSFRLGSQELNANVPLWVLPLVGLAVGATIMAFMMWTPWASMKRTLAGLRERLGVEQARNKDLAAKLKAAGARLRKAQGTSPSADESGGDEESELPADA